MQGKSINGFTLQRLLGVGGMAEVWLAENSIGKKAAVKLLSFKFCDDDAIVARFENEARVMVRLDHPNIRQVYDYITMDGRPCIIMEYLEGADLKSMMTEGHQFYGSDLVKWWNQMVQALNYTHEKGVVHRDIKPSNIFIDHHGDVKLLDFGIAKNSDSVANTKTGSTLGTILYMSPEQVKDPKHVSYKSDLYSLAVTFVHLITSKSPYDSSSSSNFEIQMNIVREPLNLDSLPPTWRDVLEPYLNKDPLCRPELKVVDREMIGEETIFPRNNNPWDSNENLNPHFGITEVIKPDNTLDLSKTADLTMTDPTVFLQESIPVLKNSNNDLTFEINGVPFVMKRVEGGIFQMGATSEQGADAREDEKPVHPVKLSSFYIGETPVTQAQWKAVMGYECMSVFKGDNRPVDNAFLGSCILDNNVLDFLYELRKKTGKLFRLPTEAEWEFAARGGMYGKGFKYAGSNNIAQVAWFEGNSSGHTHPVKRALPNELGIYDMSGNVLEWCQDIYDEYTIDSQINPCVKESDTGLHHFVARGGCWYFKDSLCRVSSRFATENTAMTNWFGFRLAISVPYELISNL